MYMYMKCKIYMYMHTCTVHVHLLTTCNPSLLFAEEGKDDKDDDVLEELNSRERELRAYLLYNEPLSEEAMEELASQFWHTEPFR